MTEEEIRRLGYAFPRQLPDGRWIGLMQMNFTTGLFVGLDSIGYASRYCYEYADAAIRASSSWDGEDDPPGPWIKHKAKGGDRLNPNEFKL